MVGNRSGLAALAPYASRAVRGVEEPVIRAFVRLAQRQRARGGYTPAVEQALAELVGGLDTKDKRGKPRASSAAVNAVTDQFAATYIDDEGFVNEAGEQVIAPLVESIR